MNTTHAATRQPSTNPMDLVHVDAMAERRETIGTLRAPIRCQAIRRDGTAWTLVRRFEAGQDMFVAADRHTISFRLDLALLGNPSQLRAASHVLWGQAGGEWKDLWPAGHTPWLSGGGTFEIIEL
jgi:hypothetical protein